MHDSHYIVYTAALRPVFSHLLTCGEWVFLRVHSVSVDLHVEFQIAVFHCGIILSNSL